MIKDFVNRVANWRTTIIGLSIGLGAILFGAGLLTKGIAIALAGVACIAFIISKDAK